MKSFLKIAALAAAALAVLPKTRGGVVRLAGIGRDRIAARFGR